MFITTIFTTLVTSIIINWLTNKKVKGKIIAKAIRGMNFSLINGIILFILSFISIFLFINHYYKDTYFLFRSEDYVDSIFDMFNESHLIELQDYFYQNKMINELLKIVMYRGTGLGLFKTGITTGLTAILSFQNGFMKSKVSTEEIYTSGGRIKFKDIASYRWGDVKSKKWVGKNIEYLDLYLDIKNSRFVAWWLKEPMHQIKLKIIKNDKDRVDKLLKEKCYMEQNQLL